MGKQEQIDQAAAALKEVSEVVGVAGDLVKGKKAKAALAGVSAGLGLAGSALALYNLFVPGEDDPVLTGIEELKTQVGNLGITLHNALEKLEEKTKLNIDVAALHRDTALIDAYMLIIAGYGKRAQSAEPSYSNLTAVADLDQSQLVIAITSLSNAVSGGAIGSLNILKSAYDAYDGDYRVDLLANYLLSYMALGPVILGAINAAEIRVDSWTNRGAPPREGTGAEVAQGADGANILQSLIDEAATGIDEVMADCSRDMIANVHKVILSIAPTMPDIWAFRSAIHDYICRHYSWRAWLTFVCKEPANVNFACQPTPNTDNSTTMQHTYGLSTGSRASVALLSTLNTEQTRKEPGTKVEDRVRAIPNFQHTPNYSSKTGVWAFLNATSKAINNSENGDANTPIIIFYQPDGDISDYETGAWGVYDPAKREVVLIATGFGIAIAKEGSYAIDGFAPATS